MTRPAPPMCWRRGDYCIRVGQNSRSTHLAAILRLDGTAVTKQVKNICPLDEEFEERALGEIYLRNFAIAIQASQPMTLMTSYNLVNGVHSANHYDMLTCYAREECGFAGYVMTDWYTSHEQIGLGFAKSTPKYGCSSSVLCVAAGNDVQMPGWEKNVSDLIDAVADGSLPLGLLQSCCVRLLRTDLACSCFECVGPFAEHLELKEFVTVR